MTFLRFEMHDAQDLFLSSMSIKTTSKDFFTSLSLFSFGIWTWTIVLKTLQLERLGFCHVEANFNVFRPRALVGLLLNK